MKSKDKFLNLRIEKSIMDDLRVAAKNDERTIASQVRKILNEWASNRRGKKC